jgi:hypothetical protein
MQRMLDLPRRDELESAYAVLGELAADTWRKAYATTMSDGEPATLAHTFRVAIGRCSACGAAQRQFPYSLLTLLSRKEREQPECILACPAGHVFEGRTDQHCSCPTCERVTNPAALYTPRRFATCSECGHSERLSDRAAADGWGWEVVLVERAGVKRREFGVPTKVELRQASNGWDPQRDLGEIPPGAETNVLLRHGFNRWQDLYPSRQRVVTETLLELAAEASDDAGVVGALRMAIIGTAEFAGHLCRWDRFYLKCNDATAGHRFNFTTFAPEPNVWGAGSIGRGTVTRRVRSMSRAAEWLQDNIIDPDVRVECGDSAQIEGKGKFDLVLTDPPYHDDVHYGELSLLFRGWAGLSMDPLEGEAATNVAAGLNADGASYSSALSRVLAACHDALHRDGRLVFSYANHEPRAWVALFAALQRAGFSAVTCVSVHSENETDFKKRGVRSCTEDLLMELSTEPFAESGEMSGDVPDDLFILAVMRLFGQVGFLNDEWESAALRDLSAARAAERARIAQLLESAST